MAITKNYFTGNGTATEYTFTFPYLNTNHIKVAVDGIVQATTEYTLQPTSNPTSVKFNTAPSNLAKIEIYRSTDLTTANNVFAAGSSVKAVGLNNNQTQALYALEEQNNSINRGEIFNYANANHSAGATAPTTPGEGDTWFDTTSGRTYIYYTDTDTSQWVESSPPFDADGDKSFTQTGTGAAARTWDSKLKDIVSVKDFGATGDGTTNDATAIQAALDAASGKSKVYLPEGTYMIGATINVPSNTHFIGSGKSSVIKGIATVGRNTTLVRTGRRGVKREYITIEDMTLDFNTSRHSVSGGERLTDTVDDTSVGGNALQDNHACCLSVCYSEHVLIKNVRALNAYKHCFDVTSPKYKRGTNGSTYDTEPSKYVTLENCYAEGAGDDNITTHHSTDITITNCISKDPSGVMIPQNSNCFEIDDGSRNVFMTDNLAIGGIYGLQIKGHDYAPAPYNVTVDGFRTINARQGFTIAHFGWYADNSKNFVGNGSTTTFDMGSGYGTTPAVYVDGVLKTKTTHYNISSTNIVFDASHIPPAPSVAGRPNILVYKSDVDAEELEITDDDGNVISYTGSSPTARNVLLSNVKVLSPRQQINTPVGGSPTTYAARFGGAIQGYQHVSLSNILFSDHSFDLADDYEDATALSKDHVFRVFYGSSNIQIQNLAIYGFSSTTYGFRTSGSFDGPLTLDGFQSTLGPQYPIRCSGGADAAYRASVTNFFISGSHSDGHGVYATAPNVYVGHGFVTGYQNPVHGSQGHDNTAQPAPFHLTRAARSDDGSEVSTPQTAIQLDLWEPVDPAQNLGTGDGTKISWGYAAQGDATASDVGFVGFEKEDSTDDHHRYTFVVGQSVDDDAPAPVTKFGIASNGGAFFKKTSTTLGGTALALSTGWHEVNANGNALTTITGGYTGQLLLLTVVSSDLVVTDNAIGGGANTIVGGTTLDVSEGDTLLLMFDGTQWRNISFGNN